MPTADVYRTAASRLEATRDVVVSLLRPIAEAIEVSPFQGREDRVSGGYLERTVTTTLNVSSANVFEIAAELSRQIAEARHRAVVCERYTEAVRRYHHSSDPRRTFPSSPASWAEHGW